MHRLRSSSSGHGTLPISVHNEHNFSKSMKSITLKCDQNSEEKNEDSENANTNFLSGFTMDGKFWWQAKRSFLFFHNQSNKGSNTICTYNFNINFDHECVITSCSGYGNLFIVGISNEEGTGYVCLFNPLLSKVIKIIAIPYTVTEVSIISLKGGANKYMHIFYKSLRFLYGIAAVGTAEGHVFILDLRLDDNETVDSYPVQIEIIHPHAKNVPELREANFEQNTHLAIELHRNCHEEGLFYFANQDNEIIEQYYPSDISVTTILFEPRCCALIIGYSFGQFHIYNMHSMELWYASELDTNSPIAKFSFQEPENDPKNFCYLWVIHGSVGLQNISHPLCINMFQLMFAEKQVLTNAKDNGLLSRKVLYMGLQLCGLRFEEELSENLYKNVVENVVLCQTVEKYNNKQLDVNIPGEEDVCVTPESSVFILGWEISDGSKKIFKVLVFDINRWYLAHMPNGISGNSSDEIFSAIWATDTTRYNKILSSNVSGSQEIQRFFSTARPLPDDFLRPSAITFNCHIVTANSQMHFKCKGVQKHAIDNLLSNQDACLSEPSSIFKKFLSAGLITLYKSSESLSIKTKREIILTSALEHSLINFLINTLQNISTGKFVASGCTLRMFHDWMWYSVQQIKEKINNLCIPIFDCTTTVLDNNTISQFDIYTTQILHLKRLFQLLATFSVDTAGQEDLNTKLLVVSLIYDYITVVRWFISNGLLPEQFAYEGEEQLMHRDGIIIYKYEILKLTFTQRRKELTNIGNVLMIDHMVQDIGDDLTQKWVQGEGEACYPPPSFMDLLNLYYMDSANITAKHCIVIYFLLDILDLFESNRDLLMSDADNFFDLDQLTRIGLFPQSFDIPLSMVKLLQGFWYLDHKDFDQSLVKFLASDTAEPYAEWQDIKIMESYIKQEQYAHALKFMLSCKNKHRGFENKELQLDVYLKNCNIIEAWKIAQSALINNEDCFSSFMIQCERNNLVKELLSFPLTKPEEDAILSFLGKSVNSSSQHLMITYYFKKGRYVEGIQAYHHTSISHTMGTNVNKHRKHQVNLQKIVRAYSNILPRVERERALSHDKRIMKASVSKKEMYKVKPIKPHVRSSFFDSPITQSSILSRKHLGKMENENNSLLVTPFRKKPEPKLNDKTESTKPKKDSIGSMLLQTPPMKRRRSRLSVQSYPNIEVSTPQSILKKRNLSRLVKQVKMSDTEPIHEQGQSDSQAPTNEVFLIGDSGIDKGDSPEMPIAMRRLSDWLTSTSRENENAEKQQNDSGPTTPRDEAVPAKKTYFDGVLKISTPQTPKVLRFKLADESPTTPIKSQDTESSKGLKTQISQFKDNNEDMDVDITGISEASETNVKETTINVTQEKEVILLSSDDEESCDTDSSVSAAKECVMALSDTDQSVKEIESGSEGFDDPLNDESDINEIEDKLDETSSETEADNELNQEVESNPNINIHQDVMSSEMKDNAEINQKVKHIVYDTNTQQDEKCSVISADDVLGDIDPDAIVGTLQEVETTDNIMEIHHEIEPKQPGVEIQQTVEQEVDIQHEDVIITNDDEIIMLDNGVENTDENDDSISSNEEENHLYISCTSSGSAAANEPLEVEETTPNLIWKQQEFDEADSQAVIPATSASENESGKEIEVQEDVILSNLGGISSDEEVIGTKEEISAIFSPEKIKSLQEEMITSDEKEDVTKNIDSGVDIVQVEYQEMSDIKEIKIQSTPKIETDMNIEKPESEMETEQLVAPDIVDSSTKADIAKPLIIEKLKADPTFVLSPPKMENIKQKLSTRKSVQRSRQIRNADMIEPTFLFSPPTTRRRSRGKQESELSTGVLDTSISSVVSVTFQEKIKKAKSPSRRNTNPVTPTRSSARLRSKSALQSDSDVNEPPKPKKSPSRKKSTSVATRKTPRKKITSETESEIDVETVPVIEIIDIVDSTLPTITEEETDNVPPKKTPTRAKLTAAVPLRRTPSRRVKSKSEYDSSVTDKESTDAQIFTTEVETETDCPTEDPQPKKTRTRKATGTQTKTSSKILKNRKLLAGKKSWSPGKEGIKLLPVISETEDQSSDTSKPKTSKRRTKKKNSSNPSPPKVYPTRTRSQRKVYSIK